MQALAHFVLVAFLRLVTRIFFRRIEVVGREHVPAAGALIFVGNHPNSLVDPVIISTTCPRPVRFAARDGLFASPFLRPILWALGSVPIKRRQDHASPAAGEAGVDNADAFRALHDVLAGGGAFGIFPEGVSYTESELQPLKTGAARIALSALAEGTSITFVPVGLSYRRKQHFRGRVLVQYGRAIVLDAEWRARHESDPRAAARALTAEIDLALRALTLNAPDFDTLRVLDGVRRLYVPIDRDLSLAEEAEVTRRLVAHWRAKHETPEVRALYSDVESYLALLEALGLSDWDLRRPVSRFDWSVRVLRHVVLLAVQVPLALPGLVLHFPLLWGATRAGEMVLARDDVRATMRMMIATGGVLASHLAVTAAIVALDPTPRGAARAAFALAFLAISGLAAIRVLEKQAIVRHGLRVLSRILALRGELAALRAQRDALRTRLIELTIAHADPAMERIVSNEELVSSTG
ncbi:MAG: lysophospholipid acyltransferase family protein [Myxococcota bacterium]|nr:lysophospholipid acyltransferase family protein [Myxococcota bacterium]